MVNELIDRANLDKSLISDGYHTFKELYEVRDALFLALLESLISQEYGDWDVWAARTHRDGTMYPGYFIAGIGTEPGKQITFHLPLALWEKAGTYANVYDFAPCDWDGHTTQDVIKRIGEL